MFTPAQKSRATEEPDWRELEPPARLCQDVEVIVTLNDLKNHAVHASLFSYRSLGRAIRRLGFVQADPIRSPARAQDLILRPRVRGYRVGDLDRSYRRLRLNEDFLYAYGFVPPETSALLQPRPMAELSAGDRKVLDIVSSGKRFHPRQLEAHLGREREVNAWGGYSKSTTRSLERLHYLGLLRVVGRENGIRLYQAVRPGVPAANPLTPDQRLHKLALLIAGILAPVPDPSLRAALRHLGRAAPDLQGRRQVVPALLASGQLDSAVVDGVRYVWPAGRLQRAPVEPLVRFLAPFDPLVWDRRRFELFWGWPYRFEAYTPLPKRKLGYYAMPLLWKAEVIGWVNIARTETKIEVDPGFVRGEPPVGSEFADAFATEVQRMRAVL